MKELDLIGNIMALLKSGELTEEELVQYFQDHSTLLSSNIDSAYVRYGKKSLQELVKGNFARYFENEGLILSNRAEFAAVKDRVIDKAECALENDIPELFLVPCLGLFSSGGWAQKVDEKHHICLAMELRHEHMDVVLAHEIAHGVKEGNWNTILDGLYNEGFATYVSSVIFPGHNEEIYFFMDKEWYVGCLDWMDKNKSKILADSARPFKVLDEYHLFYFGSGFADYPRIGYVIGHEFLRFLNQTQTIKELRRFGLKAEEMESAFKEFILGRTPGCATPNRT